LPSENAAELSDYAKRSKKELVAEVFVASMLGFRLPQHILDEYELYHGPPLPT